MARDCTCSLHVSRIRKGVKTGDLRAAFERFGKIKDVYIPMDFYSKESRGFGYVELQAGFLAADYALCDMWHWRAGADRFYDREDAEDAYDRRRDILVRGDPVTIEFARGQRK
ncbi:hypothetical protein IWQ56_002868, partial [Coemansia nantahalensis]